MQSLTALRATCGIIVLSLQCAACAPPASEPTSSEEAPAGTAAPAPRDVGEQGGASREVVVESLPYAEIDEELVYGHFAIPADMVDPLPAVLVVHDWWGLNEDVRVLSEQLAGAGYIVLAADLFAGQTAASVSAARDLEISAVERPDDVRDNLRQAIDFIRVSSGAPTLAIVGFGFGGGWALKTAIEHSRDLSAVVSFYGQVITREEDLTGADVPFLGFFLESDRAVPADSVGEFEALMQSMSRDTEVQILADGRRGFIDRSSGNYDAALADRTWTRMLDFLETHTGADR